MYQISEVRDGREPISPYNPAILSFTYRHQNSSHLIASFLSVDAIHIAADFRSFKIVPVPKHDAFKLIHD